MCSTYSQTCHVDSCRLPQIALGLATGGRPTRRSPVTGVIKPSCCSVCYAALASSRSSGGKDQARVCK